MKPIYFHANKDKRVPAEGKLHDLVLHVPQAAPAAGLKSLLTGQLHVPSTHSSLFPICREVSDRLSPGGVLSLCPPQRGLPFGR